MFDVCFKAPSNILIVGATGSGKTTLVYNLLQQKHAIFSRYPFKVFLFYQENQPLYEQMQKENLISHMYQGIPSIEDIKEIVTPFTSTNEHIICIYDDLMNDINSETSKIFTIFGHHLNVTNIFLSQSLFINSPHYRTISQNCHYLFLCKMPRDSSQIIHLAKQFSPYNTRWVVESYKAATKKPFSYLLFDFHQAQTDIIRLRNNLFPHEWPIQIFCPPTISH